METKTTQIDGYADYPLSASVGSDTFSKTTPQRSVRCSENQKSASPAPEVHVVGQATVNAIFAMIRV